MPQGPLVAATALTTANITTFVHLDGALNQKVSNQGDTGLLSTGQINAAMQIKAGAGNLRGVENLNINSLTTSSVGSLTIQQIGAFYDVALASVSLTLLTTTQVATLTTAQLVALAVPTVADISYGSGNGVPIKNGIVWVPGGGNGTPTQPANVIYK